MDIASRLDQPLQSFEAYRDAALVHGQEGPVLLEPYVGDLLIDRSGIFFLALRKRSALESAAAVVGMFPGGYLVALPLILLSASTVRWAKEVEMLRGRAVGDLLARPGSLRIEWCEVRAVTSLFGGLGFEAYRGNYHFRGNAVPSGTKIQETCGDLIPSAWNAPTRGRWSRILHKKIL